MGKKTSSDTLAQDSAGVFYQHVITNTPYYGPLLRVPNGISPFNCQYYPTNILVSPSTNKVPSFADTMTLEETLSVSSTLASIASFICTGAGVAQANELFYINEVGKVVRQNSQRFFREGFREAAEIGKIGKNVGTAFSWVGVGITLGQVANEGLNINTGTDLVVCAIGFVPGVGWVISGAYSIANTIVIAKTGKPISENSYNSLFDVYVRTCNELKARMFGWYNVPFTFR